MSPDIIPHHVGIIGTGRIARLHAATLREIENAHLVGVFDKDATCARQFAKEHHCRSFTHVEALLEAIDAVIIAVPNCFHRDYVLRSINAERHILCEKPMAENLASAQAMFEAKPSHLIGTIGFNYRFLPIVDIIHKTLASGTLGDILAFDAAFLKDSARRRTQFNWRDGPEQHGSSGSLGDLGSHLIDMACNLFNTSIDESSLSGTLQTHVRFKENKPVCVDDYAHVVCRLACGIPFTLTTSKSASAPDLGVRITIKGTHRSLLYETQTPLHWSMTDNATGHTSTMVLPHQRHHADPAGEIFGWADSMHCQMRSWLSAITTLSPLPQSANFSDGVRVQRALQAMLNTLPQEEQYRN
ncbi:Gfo/Idh/MocA family protein [Desulfovibrio inopinatus]|uniref:Gfo/Idh/MocA family protein n=1 Tax=Desulfovibrio inopinatus TaxID=102109 RepID=UPI00040300BC|nr:Gfo/Idh/MocA family oxidoreductase [Desulfovibrio inopinatus]